jgi:hypothetical protein
MYSIGREYSGLLLTTSIIGNSLQSEIRPFALSTLNVTVLVKNDNAHLSPIRISNSRSYGSCS